MPDNKQVANPMASLTESPPMNTDVMNASESSRAVAEIQSALVIAQRFPRDQKKAMDRILNACQRPTLAESSMYAYARGGSSITGPSIRLAESLAQNWGNMQFGIEELSSANGKSEVKAFAWDLETNTRRSMTFTVPHERHTRQGITKLTDPRDIYETVANMGSRRVRACILAVIPGDVVESAVEQCKQTLTASVDITPEALRKMASYFETKFGVTTEQIEARIQCRLEAIKPAQWLSLRDIKNSLADGMSKPEDWFVPIIDKATGEIQNAGTPKKNSGTNSAKQKLAEQQSKAESSGKDTAAKDTGADTSGEAAQASDSERGIDATSDQSVEPAADVEVAVENKYDQAMSYCKTVDDFDGLLTLVNADKTLSANDAKAWRTKIVNAKKAVSTGDKN